jgi:hypothetical protein
MKAIAIVMVAIFIGVISTAFAQTTTDISPGDKYTNFGRRKWQKNKFLA